MTDSSDTAQSAPKLNVLKFRLPTHEGRLRLPSKTTLLKAMVGIVAAAGVGFGLLHTKLFAVERIDVLGINSLPAEQVLAESRLKEGQFLINIDGEEIASRLRANPWVKEASVATDWPHVVKVNIIERKPIAVAQTADKKWAVIGEEGVVLRIDDAPQTGLPTALGVQSSSTPGDRLNQQAVDLISVAAAMPESLRPRVAQMDTDQAEGIRLGLNTGTIVVLGDSSRLPEKLTAAAAVLSDQDPTKIGKLDVRSPEMPISTPSAKAKSAASTSTSTTNSNSSTKTSTTNKPSTSGSKPSTSSTSTTVKSSTKNSGSSGNSSSTTTTAKPKSQE